MGAKQLGAIFDMDGVLVESSEAHFEAWVRLGEEIGRAVPRSVFDETFGMHNRQIIPIWFDEDVEDEELDRLSVRKEEFYRELARDRIEALPGIPALIHGLHADGFRLAVGSSGPRPNVELILEILDVNDRFHGLSTGDEVRHGKPHPEVFEKAAAKLDLPPASCVVIEDAPQGVEAGKRAGARVIAVTSTRPAAELAAADLVVESLAELTVARVRDLLA